MNDLDKILKALSKIGNQKDHAKALREVQRVESFLHVVRKAIMKRVHQALKDTGTLRR